MSEQDDINTAVKIIEAMGSVIREIIPPKKRSHRLDNILKWAENFTEAHPPE